MTTQSNHRSVHSTGKFRVVLWIVLLSAPFAAMAADTSAAPLTDLLRQQLVRQQAEDRFICRGELICGIAELPLFYQRRDYRPAWIANQRFTSMATSLIETIAHIDQEGLRPTDYHLTNLQELLAKIWQDQVLNQPTDPAILVDLDLLLTDAYLLLSSHLLAGRVNPETIHTDWMVANPAVDLAQQLQVALDAGQIQTALERLKPSHRGYRHLKRKLELYRKMARNGGWPFISEEQKLRYGEHGSQILMLRKRLILSGDLEPEDRQYPFLFDDTLAAALRSFQRRHGLTPTGTVDAATLSAMNEPIEKRIQQMVLNLERWRWIPRDLGRKHILVNIADFHLTVAEDDQAVHRMRVVVGRDYRKTPVFSDQLTYLELHPYWNIPSKIAVLDILPKIKQDPLYLNRQKIKVFRNWQEDARPIDPLSVDWSQLTPHNFSYRLRQDPGPQNALGKIKFMLPNKFAVYLHDTPSPSLFEKNQRGLSSGCIRVERPLDLAEYLLKNQDGWSRKAIEAALASGQQQVIHLSEPIPVHLLYWTAWVDRWDRVHFRDDIYDRDKPLSVALAEKPPRVTAYQ